MGWVLSQGQASSILRAHGRGEAGVIIDGIAQKIARRAYHVTEPGKVAFADFPRGRNYIYPWDEWGNGKWWILIPPHDGRSVDSLYLAAHNYVCKKERQVRVIRGSHGAIARFLS